MATATRGVLTARQLDMLRVIVRHWGECGNAPTIREIAAEMGISSPNGVTCHLKALQKKGWIEWNHVERGGGVAAQSRGIVVPELLAAAKAAAKAYLNGLK